MIAPTKMSIMHPIAKRDDHFTVLFCKPSGREEALHHQIYLAKMLPLIKTEIATSPHLHQYPTAREHSDEAIMF